MRADKLALCVMQQGSSVHAKQPPAPAKEGLTRRKHNCNHGLPHPPPADPDCVRASDGRTPLLLAAEAGQTEAAEVLLAGGANLAHKDDDGCSAVGDVGRGSFDLVMCILHPILQP